MSVNTAATLVILFPRMTKVKNVIFLQVQFEWWQHNSDVSFFFFVVVRITRIS